MTERERLLKLREYFQLATEIAEQAIYSPNSEESNHYEMGRAAAFAKATLKIQLQLDDLDNPE